MKFNCRSFHNDCEYPRGITTLDCMFGPGALFFITRIAILVLGLTGLASGLNLCGFSIFILSLLQHWVAL
jgi:hypothetical protein